MPATTSTSSTTTPSTSSSTTSSTAAPSSTTTTTLFPTAIDLIGRDDGGTCGTVQDAGGGVLRQLACSGLSIGGGTSALPQAILPGGSVSRFALSDCSGTTCSIGPHAGASAVAGCTQVGCAFTAPVPIPDGGQTACVLNTFASAPTATIDLTTGVMTNLAVALNANIWVTGIPHVDQPCPRCVTEVAATPDDPQDGICDRGAGAGLPCTTTSPHGLSRECLPGGSDGSVDAGVVFVNLTPVTTGTTSRTNPAGMFCPGQTHAGCFGLPGCRTTTVTGTPAGSLLPVGSTRPVVFASTFCVPATPSSLVNFFAALPGPGAAVLSADLRLVD